MTIEEYKRHIIIKIGMANDCEETEKLMEESINLLKRKNLPQNVIREYLMRLKMSLIKMQPSDYDYTHWCNIQCAILYLRKLMTPNR